MRTTRTTTTVGAARREPAISSWTTRPSRYRALDMRVNGSCLSGAGISRVVGLVDRPCFGENLEAVADPWQDVPRAFLRCSPVT
jgi:hypothetical protein